MQLQDNIALAGLVITMGGAGRLFVSYGTGFLLDRFGRRRVAIVGVTIRMIFSFAEGLSPTYLALVGSRFMSGVGTAIWGTGLATITADISTRADRGTITGSRQGYMHLGQVIGPILGAAAWAATGDIRVPFFINGFSKLICLLVFLFVMVETRSLSDVDVPETPAKAPVEPVVAKPGTLETWGAVFASGFILVLVGLFAAGLFRAAVGDTIIPVYVRNELGLPQSALGFVLSAMGVGGLGASFIGGRMTDRWGVGSVMIPGALISAAGLAILIAGPGALVLVLLGAVLGASTTLVHVGTNAFAIDISPRGRRGRFFGQTQTAMHSAALVGPIVVGAIADWVGFGAAFAVLAAFFVFLVPIGVMMARHEVNDPDGKAMTS
jgi:MFS family permease